MKYLGIQTDECHNWDAQYIVVRRKLKTGRTVLSMLKGISPQSKSAEVYKALFESHLILH